MQTCRNFKNQCRTFGPTELKFLSDRTKFLQPDQINVTCISKKKWRITMPFSFSIVTINTQLKRSYLILEFTNNMCASPHFECPSCQDIATTKLVRKPYLNLLGIRNVRMRPCCLWPSPFHPDPERKNYGITDDSLNRSFGTTVSNNLSVQRSFYRQDRQDRHFSTTLQMDSFLQNLHCEPL
jgi:hypothetical protein